jgi:hypothetical protein
MGYYAPYAQFGLTPNVFALGWTQTSDYVNVDVFANLFTPGFNGTVNYELVKAIGSGTSFAANGIVRGTATTPINPADVDLFHPTSLGAGTYYLVLDSPNAGTSWLYNFPGSGSYTSAQGVSFNGDFWAPGAAINTTYSPGSSFSGNVFPVQFLVTGTVAAPEPATFGVTGLALMGLGMILRAWRTNIFRFCLLQRQMETTLSHGVAQNTDMA